jgi:hypothetical protein
MWKSRHVLSEVNNNFLQMWINFYLSKTNLLWFSLASSNNEIQSTTKDICNKTNYEWVSKPWIKTSTNVSISVYPQNLTSTKINETTICKSGFISEQSVILLCVMCRSKNKNLYEFKKSLKTLKFTCVYLESYLKYIKIYLCLFRKLLKNTFKFTCV